jgi:hypothetical protein
MPPHSSHLLQPLDVGCFSPLKTAFSKLNQDLIRNHIFHVTKVDFITAFKQAFLASFTQANVQAGFRGSGLHPFDPEAVVFHLDPVTSFTGQRNRRGNATTNSSAFVIFLSPTRHFVLYPYIPLVDESILLQAATAYRNGEYTSIRACADAFSVSYSTLSYRLSGRVSRSIACESSQILSTAEEKALVKWITRLSTAGCPITLPLTRNLAEEIQKRRVALSPLPRQYPPIGKHWLDRFRKRYPIISTISSRKIDASRFDVVNYPTINAYFTALSDLFLENSYSPNAIFNVDESGFALGDTLSSRVLVNKEDLRGFKKIAGRQEWITAIECIGASGVVLPPLLIFKAKHTNTGWILQSTPPN